VPIYKIYIPSYLINAFELAKKGYYSGNIEQILTSEHFDDMIEYEKFLNLLENKTKELNKKRDDYKV
jgi:hypothetical protein